MDMNVDMKDKVKSTLMHVIFTPKGQKLRDPEFGTSLIRYIFDPNDELSWETVQQEVSEVVSRYVKGVTVNSISVLQNEENGLGVYVRVDYTVNQGYKSIKDQIVTKL
jgi:phage baseplate assembly protein W